MLRYITFAFVLASVVAPARAQELPADLAAVPPNAMGFVHVRVAELWKSDFLKELRTSIQKAGPKAIEAFDQRFVPAPSTFERVTVIAFDPRGGAGDSPIVGIITCSAPFEAAKAYKSLLPMGKEMKAGDKTYVADAEIDLAIHVMNDRTLALAPAAAMQSFLENKAKGTNPFAAALKEAAGKHQVTLALNASMLPGEAVAELPEPLQPLVRAKMAALSLDIGSELRVDVRLHYADEAQAKTGEAAAREGVKMAGDALAQLAKDLEKQLASKDKRAVSPITELPEAALAVAGLGAIATAQQFLKDLPLKREGDALAATVVVPAGPYASLLGVSGLSMGFGIPFVFRAQMGASRSISANNMKQILLAFHNYESAFRRLPAAAICDPSGKPLLSWRVAVLPFIGEDQLYKQFKLDEPWDSEHNKKLVALMPKAYAAVSGPPAAPGTTHTRAFYGKGAAFELKQGLRIADFTDGLSNTLMLVEATDGVEWTKPDDFAYDPEKPLPKLGRSNPDGFWMGLADGSVRLVPKTVSEKTLRALITRAGNEVIENFDK